MELQMQIELATQMLLDIMSHIKDEELRSNGIEMVNFLYNNASKFYPKDTY